MLASALLGLFFAAVGSTAKVSNVVTAGPAIMCLTSITLGIHVAFSATAFALLNRIFGKGTILLDEALVASNANVGGPATAASFAAFMGSPQLVIPATTWGTVGYAAATPLALFLFSLLT